MSDRLPNGRFAPGNQISSAGGRARAAKLSRRKRRRIARMGRRALVERRFMGNDRAQRQYMADLGRWAYEQMTGIDNSVSRATHHPGTPSEFMCRYLQIPIFGLNSEIDFRGDT